MAGGMPIFWPLQRISANLWNSSEQLYQAAKYDCNTQCIPESNPQADPYVRNRIRAATNPKHAKLTQKCAAYAGLIRKDWADPEKEVRIKAMLWVLELKLYWNQATFGWLLAQTKDMPIVEVSSKDDFWGCYIRGDYLVGRNVLGKLLMQVRERSAEIKRGNFTHPDGWLL